MLAEWSAECTADDPVLVVPWSSNPSDPESGPHFVDLRDNPYDLDHLPEAEQHPPLMQALRALNAARSPVFTAKCDAWSLSAEELEDLHLNLYLGAPEGLAVSSSGFASYIDLVPRDRSLFASVHQQEQLLSRLTRRAVSLNHPDALLDCVLRPALVDLADPPQGFKEGFSISLYIKASGPDDETAWNRWAAALEDIIALLRSKDLAFA
jgi:hypothetical protein